MNGIITFNAKPSGLATASFQSIALFAFLLILFLGNQSVSAQKTWIGAANGDFNTATNWSPNGTPTAADALTVGSGKSLVVNSAANALSITFVGSTTASSISVASGQTLTVAQDIVLENLATGNTIASLTGAGTINCASMTVGGQKNPVFLNGTKTVTLNSSVAFLNISGIVNIRGKVTSVIIFSNPVFNLQSGEMTVGGNVVFDQPSLLCTVTLTNATGAQSGKLSLGGADPITGATLPTVTLNGTSSEVIYTRAGAQAIYNTSYNNLTLSGSGAKSLALISTTAVNNLKINTGVTLDASTASAINCLGNFTNNGAFTPGLSTVTFTGTASDIGGTSLNTFYNLTINKTGGVAQLSSDAKVTNTLTMTDGHLNIGNRILTLSANAVAGTPGATKMIIANNGGELRRTYTGTGSYVFPVGDNSGTTEYSPITVNVTAGTFSSAYVGVAVVDAVHPNNASTTHYLTRYWKVNQSGITGAVATIAGTYINTAADVQGTTGLIKSAQLKGTFNAATNPWIKFTALAGATLTATGAVLPSGQTSYFTGLTGADPTVSITGGGTYCTGNTITLTAVPVGDAAFTYAWSAGLGTNVSATPNNTVAGTTNYVVTVTDGNGFVATANTNVAINASPAFGSLTPLASPVCENSTVAFALHGLLPNSTSTVSYTIGGGTTQTLTGIVADAGGDAVLNINLPLAYNNQVLAITNILRTGITPTCPLVVSANNETTLLVNANVTYYEDGDGDGFGNQLVSQVSCFGIPDGYIDNSTDCDDLDSTKNAYFLFYADTDGDGYGSGSQVSVCAAAEDTPPDGYSVNDTDCNVTDPLLFNAYPFYADTDNDGYGAGVLLTACAVDNDTPPVGFSINDTDCSPANPALFNTYPFYADTDGDGYGSGDLVDVCNVDADNPPSGYSINKSDCSPDNAAVHQDFPFYEDLDHDSYGTGELVDVCTAVASPAPSGYSLVDTDCDDTKSLVHPGAVEVGYNLIDDDCDGLIDEGFPPKITTLQLCNYTIDTIDTFVYANIVGGAQGYRWRVTTMSGPNQGQIQFIDTPLRAMKITQLGTYAFNTTYKVEIAVYYAGFLQPYMPSNCTVSTPATTTQLATCGGVMGAMSDAVYATYVPFAAGYKFRVTDPSNPSLTQELERPL
ncbi:MAG TPA: putative metal-binding motif-containing protein, partial [Flavobacterium sp.]|nr:putative metal-binding motif-containing protein [Flavobacterium sp.]